LVCAVATVAPIIPTTAPLTIHPINVFIVSPRCLIRCIDNDRVPVAPYFCIFVNKLTNKSSAALGF
jgi:hypothetical protein